MSWTNVYSIWPALIEHLCEDFPHLDRCALDRFRGCQEAMIGYLADTHDLTLAEAEESLADWVARRAVSVADRMAA